MYINKWYTFTACAYLQLAAGICYSFTIYSPAVKEVFGLDQPHLEGLASALLSGGYFAWLPGLLYNYLQDHYKLAPRLVAALGVALHTLGYGLIWLAATERVRLPYWGLLLAGLSGGAAIVFLDAACVVTSLRNFSRERGHVVGVLKAFLGSAASVGATIYAGGFPHTREGQLGFLGFLALVPALVAVPAVPLLNLVPYLERSETTAGQRWLSSGARFGAAYGTLLALMTYQLIAAVAKSVSPDPWSPGAQSLNMWAVVAVTAVPLVLPLGTGGPRSVPASVDGPDSTAWQTPGGTASPVSEEHCSDASLGYCPAGPLREPLLPEQAEEKECCIIKPRQGPAGPQDAVPQLSLSQCLISLDFWMLFGILFVGMGSGFTLLNNLGQMVTSREGPPASRTTLVQLFTTLNCVGRMALGFLSELALHSYGLPRTLFLIATSAGLTLSALGISFCSLSLLYPFTMLAGLCFGFYWGLFPILTSELFGLRNFASNQSVVHAAPTLGCLLLSTCLAGSLYERRRHVEHPCVGLSCFRETFLVIASLCFLATGLSAILHARSRHIYRALAREVKEYDQGVHVSARLHVAV